MSSSMASVTVFGNNLEGQAGVGSGEDYLGVSAPLPVEASEVVRVVSNMKQSYLLTKDGSVWSCGENNELCSLGRSGKKSVFSRLDSLENYKVTDIGLGQESVILVVAGGTCIVWGRNDSGQLGLGDGERGNVGKPKPVSLLRDGVLTLSCGRSHTIALSKTGTLFTWGANRSGQLGDGQLTSSCSPIPLRQLVHRPVVSISCGEDFSLCLTIGGSVYAWGSNTHGQLGCGDTKMRLRPELIRPLRAAKVFKIAAGKSHSAAVSSSGLLFTFGANSYGQCGHGEQGPEGRTVLSPKVVERLQSSERVVFDVSLGASHSLVLARSGSGVVSTYLMGNGASLIAGLGQCQVPTLVSAETLFPHIGASGDDQVLVPLGVATGALANHSFVFSRGCTALQRTPLPFVDLKGLESAAQRLLSGPGMVKGSSEYDKALKHLRETVAAAFGSISVLNASFRLHASNSITSSDGLGLDLCSVRQAYQLLLQVNSEPLLATLGRALVQATGDLTNVNLDDGENLQSLLVILENPLLLSQTSMAVCLERISNTILALSTSSQNTLFGWLRHYPRDFFARVVSVFQGFMTYCVNSLPEKIAVASKVLQVIYTINQTARIVPESVFVNAAVCKRIDLGAEREKWIASFASGANSTTAPGSRVFSILHHPFLIDSTTKAAFLRLDFLENQLWQQNRFHASSPFINPANNQLLQPLTLLPGCIPVAAHPSSARSWELHCELAVRRSHVLPDLLQQLVTIVLADRETLSLPLRARFIGEEAVDQGGVRKELFAIAMRELVVFSRILAPCSDGRFLWFKGVEQTKANDVAGYYDEKRELLDSSSAIEKDNEKDQNQDKDKEPGKVDEENRLDSESELRTLLAVLESCLAPAGQASQPSRGPASQCTGTFTMGLLQGLAAFHGCYVDLRLPPSIYKLLDAKPGVGDTGGLQRSNALPQFGLADLHEVDPSLAASLQALMDHPSDAGSIADAFGASFVASANPLLGELAAVKGTTVELVSNGSSLLVDRANRARFVQLFVNHALHGCVRDSAEQYICGLQVFFKGRTVERLVVPGDMEVLLCGSREFGDLSDLRLSTTYRGGVIHDEHKVAQWFWNVVSALNLAQQRQLLQFATGCSRVPAGGLSHIRLQIQHTNDGPDSLPQSHTCFNLIDLPLSYPSMEWLRAKLLLSLEHSEGFGLL